MIFRILLTGCCVWPLVANAADQATEPSRWQGEGAFGFTSTSGNTNSETLTANLGIVRESVKWKHTAVLKIFQAETDNQESADSLEFTAPSEYALSDKYYLFGNLRHEEDEFSGFEYQDSLAFGVG